MQEKYNEYLRYVIAWEIIHNTSDTSSNLHSENEDNEAWVSF